jgi:predicted DNA-binding transcriptional regulator YafY
LNIQYSSGMSRSERLLNLLQILRRYRHAVSGQTLADELGIGVRTLYRDIASLKAQGAAIEGGVGVGYIMKPGFMLPPLMFGSVELEALVLGMRLVMERRDSELTQGAQAMLTKISAVLPPPLRRELEVSTLFAGMGQTSTDATAHSGLLRESVRLERKLELSYQTAAGAVSQRTVWPFALAYFERVQVLMCWCELRGAFRNFRTDRINQVVLSTDRYPQSKQALLEEWRRSMPARGITILSETDTGWL